MITDIDTLASVPEDLRLTRLAPGSAEGGELLVAAYDAGGASAMSRVAAYMAEHHTDMGIVLATAGPANTVFADMHDAAPGPTLGRDDFGSLRPGVVALGFSTKEYRGLERYAAGLALRAIVGVEDTPGSGRFFIGDEGLSSFRRFVCVVSDTQHYILHGVNPGIEFAATGQPAFDALFYEDTTAVAKEVRSCLKLDDSQKLLVYMAGRDLDVREVAASLAQLQTNVRTEELAIAFCKHPGDLRSTDELYARFAGYGVGLLKIPEGVTNGELGAAADLIVTHRSTEVLKATIRRKLVLQIARPEDWLHPVADSSAALLVDPRDLAQRAVAVLDENSEIRRLLNNSIEQARSQMHPDSTQRVARVILRAMRSN